MSIEQDLRLDTKAGKARVARDRVHEREEAQRDELEKVLEGDK